MLIEARRPLLLISGTCGLLGVAGWAFYGALFSFAPFQDFMVFYTAARACIEGNLPLVFDGFAFTAKINAQFVGWFNSPVVLHPWVYPPTFLLMVIPFGILPFAVSYGLFLILTFVMLHCAIRCYVPPGYKRWLCMGSLLLSPATAFTVGVGQNGFMTSALLIGGFGLLRRNPLLAGMLLGLLTFKPQLWLLIPMALVAAREWKVLAITLGGACLLVLASVAAFGVDPWREWLTLMIRTNPMYGEWLKFGRLNGQSAYAEAILLGARVSVANVSQAIAIMVSAAIVWWCFRVPAFPRDLRLVVLLTATILAAPHVANYDAVMVTVAVSLFLCRALEDGFHFGDAILIVVVWGVELLDPPRVFRWGLITPLIYYVFLARVVARGTIQTRSRLLAA